MTPAGSRARAALAWLGRFPRDGRDGFLLAAGAGSAIGLFLVAFVLGDHSVMDGPFGGVAQDGYLELARSLVRGDGYVFEPGGDAVSHRPPLYPLLLVPVVLLPEAWQRPALVVLQSLLLGAICASTFRLAARWFGEGTARVATRLLLIDPWLYWMTTVPMVPLLQTALYLWLVRLLFAWGPGSRVTSPSLLAGLAAGALALTHGSMLVTIPVLFGVAGVVALRRDPAALRKLALASLLIVACVAPWTARNWVVFHRLIPVASNAGFAYFAGSAHWGQGALSGKSPPEDIWGAPAGAEGLYMAGVAETYEEASHYYGLRDIELDARLGRLALAHAREDLPRLFTKIALNGLENYFPIVFPLVRGSQPTALERVLGSPMRLLRSAFYLAWWVLALVALLRPPKGRGLELALIVAALVVFVGPYLPFLTFIAHSMYNFGSLPYLAILAGLGWRVLLGGAEDLATPLPRRERPSAPTAA
ncbi:MAG TPA: hypothetical protein VFY49_17120 [Myxococcota bacterium]|nr:hypothetical protein [Myxococcota bacterium]